MKNLITATILSIMSTALVSYFNVVQARTPIIVNCDYTNSVYTFHIATWGKLVQIEERHIKSLKYDGFRLTIENNFGQRMEFRIRRNKSCDNMFNQRNFLKTSDIRDRMGNKKEFLK